LENHYQRTSQLAAHVCDFGSLNNPGELTMSGYLYVPNEYDNTVSVIKCKSPSRIG